MTHLFWFVFIPLLLLTNLLAEPSHDSKRVIKIATLAPEGSSWLQIWTPLRQEIEEKTNGQITSQMYAGGVMGDDPDMVRKLRLGQLDVVAVTSLGAKLLVQELAVFDLPFLFQNWEEAEHVRNQLRPEFEKRFEEKGLYLIDWVHQGFVHINSQMPIRTPEELSRQKVWAWAGEEVSIATLEALGVKPITTPVPEALSALQTGLVTVIPTGVLPLLALQWFNEVNYITPLNMRYELAVVAANKKNWDQIDPDRVKMVNETFANHRGEISTRVQKDSDIALEEMFRQGIKKIELTPLEREVFAQRTRSVWDKFAGKLYPRPLLDRVLEEREIFRNAKNRPLSTL